MTYTLGSLFDGIGGWPLAATKRGINPVWAAEIEPFPIEVTKKHFPTMKHLGDITGINGAEIEPVDIICMGSPCQDLSIAGKREGLAGARSGLFMDAVRIVREMREATNGKYPRFVVWENVPGAFSSNKGNDFRAVLEEITESSIPMPKSGRWAKSGMVRSNECDVAWRTLDAQYWGVPQRRKRIFLVADFRGQCAAEILFKPESVSGYPAASGSQGQRIAGNVESGIGAAGFKLGQGAKAHGIGWQKEIAPTLSAMDSGNKPAVAIWDMTHVNGVMRPVKDGIVPKLNTRMGTGGNQVPIVQKPILINDKATRYKGGGDISGTLQPTVYSMGHDERSASFTPNKTDPLTASDYKQPVIANVGYKVRRLTPTECERLQGLPDGYTAGGSDSARYKALGNGMAQPCADFVIRKISRVLGR